MRIQVVAACKIEKKKGKVIPLTASRGGKTIAVAEDGKAASAAMEEAKRCLGTQICDSCEVCSLLCPDLCIIRDPLTGKIIIDYDYCKGCGICAFVCPRGAITMVLEK